MNRIVCIGNPYLDQDALGSRVFELLRQRDLPQDVVLIDGGLAGLNLLTLFDHCDRIVFVDTISGDEADGVIVLRADQIESIPKYGHSGGLGYLIRAHKAISVDPAPEMIIVGAGMIDAAGAAADMALNFAQGLIVPDPAEM